MGEYTNVVGLGLLVSGVGFPIGGYLLFQCVKMWLGKKNGNGNSRGNTHIVTEERCTERVKSLRENVELKFDNVKDRMESLNTTVSGIHEALKETNSTQTEILKAVRISNGGS